MGHDEPCANVSPQTLPVARRTNHRRPFCWPQSLLFTEPELVCALRAYQRLDVSVAMASLQGAK
jgi:hypothetical protein